MMDESISNISSSSSPPTKTPVILRCPRCDSTNTKFCYYNNYSLSQPRHFCKACKRYWTRGGTLRNVPVGGGCRKNKRVKKSSSSTAVAVAAAAAVATTASTDPARSSSSLFSSLASANLDNFNSFLFSLPSSSTASTPVANHATNFASYSLQQPCTAGFDSTVENNRFQLGFGTSLEQSGIFSLNGCQRKLEDYTSLSPYQNLYTSPREVKGETESNLIDPWQLSNYVMNPLEALAGSGDSSYLYWGSAALPDVTNSSIAPMI